jgi:hypothetical protein
MKLYMKRTLTGFSADDHEGAEKLRKFPPGTVVEVEISQPRSLKQLRYYYALCTIVAQNHATMRDKDQVDQALRILTGHCDVFTLDGRTVETPRRLAFDKLEQADWEDYLQRAKEAVAEHLLPGVGIPDLEDEILRMLG